MNLYDVALSAYETTAARPDRHGKRRALLREEIALRSLPELLHCIERIERDDADDAEALNCLLGTELEMMRARIRQLMLH